MYKEWVVSRKERSVIINIDNLYADECRAELVAGSRIVSSDFNPVQILYLSVQWHCGLDYASPWRVDDER